jgi:sialate O-acetylesterase
MKRIVSLLFLAPGLLFAELSVPHFFSDHMILQRERAAAIWGKADANAEVTFPSKASRQQPKRRRTANGARRSKPARQMRRERCSQSRAGADKLEIKDVLVGEVWFASGQSNMFYTMNRSPEYAGLIKESNHPALRMFNAPLVTAAENQDDIEGVWQASTPETVPGFSAVAFFFARKLHLDLGIPVGVIKSAWGGKPVETFTSREALNTLPGTKALVDATLKAEAEYDPTKAQAAYEASLEQWKATMAAPRRANRPRSANACRRSRMRRSVRCSPKASPASCLPP